jgi:hypothetical protein
VASERTKVLTCGLWLESQREIAQPLDFCAAWDYNEGMMPMTMYLSHVRLVQDQQSELLQTLEAMLGAGLEIATLLLAFTLAIFVVLVFAVRVVMVVRKLPVPLDPFDMAKPVDFRALMLGSAALLSPLAALEFLPVEGLETRWVLVVAYAFEVLLVVVLWAALHLFYKVRANRSRRNRQPPKTSR